MYLPIEQESGIGLLIIGLLIIIPMLIIEIKERLEK